MSIAFEEVAEITQLGSDQDESGIEVDAFGAQIEIRPGRTRAVEYKTLYMTAPPYEAISVKETMVPATMRKRHKDRDRPELLGKPVFSKTPVHEVERGHVACLLHPSRPEHDQYQRMGLKTCMTSSFASDYEVERHMRFKHKSEWAAISSMKAEADRLETKSTAQATLEALQAQSAALLALAGGAKLPTIAPSVPKPDRAIPAQRKCPDCDFVTPEGHGAPQFVLGKHRKAAHST